MSLSGGRLAKLIMLPCLVTIFKDYEIELAKDMPRILKFQPTSFNTKPIGGINVKFIPRDNNKLK